jgi:GAF domain-containing protein
MQSPKHYIQCLIEEIMRVTEETLQASASSVLLVDTEEEELCFRFVHGPAEGILSEAALGTDTGIAGWVARHREPVIVNDASSDARFCGDIDEVTGFTTRAIICAPLLAHGRLLGVIEVLNKTDGSGFDEHDLHTLVAVAGTAAAAIDLKLAEEAVQDSEARLVNNLVDTQLDLFEPPPPGH